MTSKAPGHQELFFALSSVDRSAGFLNTAGMKTKKISLSLFSCHSALGLALVLISVITGRPVQANLQVFPTRIFLSEKSASSHVTLKNPTNETLKFRISAAFYKMSVSGEMSKVEKPTEADPALTNYLQFSPKTISIGPGETQVVRMMVKKTPADFLGDHYAHLHFEPMDSTAIKKEKEAATMVLQGRVAIAIPVVYRKGATDLQISLDQMSLKKNKEGVNVNVLIKNSGKSFSYGDIVLRAIHKGQPIEVRKVTGISSYLPQRQWNLQIPQARWTELKKETEDLKDTTFLLTYSSNPDEEKAFAAKVELKNVSL